MRNERARTRENGGYPVELEGYDLGMTLLERAEHMGVLWGLLEGARSSGRLALVSGEAGAGKSALVDTFCSRAAPEALVLTGRCDDLFAPRPLGPLSDISRTVGGSLRAAIETGDQASAFDAVLDLLDNASRPVIMVIEDVQWADDATLDLIRFTERRLGRTRGLMIVTFRDDLADDHPLRLVLGGLTSSCVARISLPPLSLEAVRTLADGRQVDPVALHRATNGNPFFIVEVLADERLGIPPTVREAVRARAGRLDPSGRDALAAAAILGTLAAPDTVMAVGACGPAELEACLAAGLLDHDGERLSFRHDLSRAAIEDGLTPWRRRALHGRALAALDDRVDVVARAHHAIAAGDDAAICRLAPEAARHCAALGAHRAAATLYASAVAHAAVLPEDDRVALHEARARACATVGDEDGLHESAYVVLEHVRAAGDALQTGAWLSWFASTSGCTSVHAAEASALRREALELLEPLGDTPELAITLSAMTGERMGVSDVEGAVAAGTRGLALAERFGLDDHASRILINMGTARATAGDDEGFELIEEGIRRARRTGNLQRVVHGYNNIAWIRDARMDPANALPALERALETAEAHELSITPSMVLQERSIAEMLAGRWADAARSANTALADPLIDDDLRGLLETTLGQIAVKRGDGSAAVTLDAALAHLSVTGDPLPRQAARIARAERAWLAGDPINARAEITALMSASEPPRDPWAAGELTLWCRRVGIAPPAATSIAEPFALHLAGHHRLAGDMWQRRWCPYHAADALGDSDDEADLRRAVEILHELGAAPRAALVQRRLRELGARDIPRGPRASTRANAAGLTARELEVAQLLADGLTNAQIAARLVVSAKTVDHHVSALLSKLDVASRRDVAAALAAARARTQDGEALAQR